MVKEYYYTTHFKLMNKIKYKINKKRINKMKNSNKKKLLIKIRLIII